MFHLALEGSDRRKKANNWADKLFGLAAERRLLWPAFAAHATPFMESLGNFVAEARGLDVDGVCLQGGRTGLGYNRWATMRPAVLVAEELVPNVLGHLRIGDVSKYVADKDHYLEALYEMSIQQALLTVVVLLLVMAVVVPLRMLLFLLLLLLL